MKYNHPGIGEPELIFSADDPYAVSLLELWFVAKSCARELTVSEFEYANDVSDKLRHYLYLHRKMPSNILDELPTGMLEQALARRTTVIKT